MKILLQGTLAILSTLVIQGCGEDGSSETSQYSDSYEFSDGSCSTDKQTFSANSESELLAKLCEALQDNARNNFCASELRFRRYEQRCL